MYSDGVRTFTPHQLLRIAYNVDNPQLRGKPVVYYGHVQRPRDTVRAVVRLLNVDGTTGEEYLFRPALLIGI